MVQWKPQVEVVHKKKKKKKKIYILDTIMTCYAKLG